jgi:hypothetical protein
MGNAKATMPGRATNAAMARMSIRLLTIGLSDERLSCRQTFDHLGDSDDEKNLSAEARARVSPSSVKITDLFLFFGSSMRPRS